MPPALQTTPISLLSDYLERAATQRLNKYMRPSRDTLALVRPGAAQELYFGVLGLGLGFCRALTTLTASKSRWPWAAQGPGLPHTVPMRMLPLGGFRALLLPARPVLSVPCACSPHVPPLCSAAFLPQRNLPAPGPRGCQQPHSPAPYPAPLPLSRAHRRWMRWWRRCGQPARTCCATAPYRWGFSFFSKGI